MNWKKALIPLLILSIALAACAAQTETVEVEVTRVITETVEVEGEAIEVTRLVYADQLSSSSSARITSYAFSGNNEPSSAKDSDGFVNDVEQTSEQSTTESATQGRMIIRNAELNLVVANTDEAIATITSMVESNGGWVVSSNVYQYSDNAKTGSITVRVPSSGFTSALDAMKAMAVEVTNESTSGQDVTDEFVDLSLQLENLEATADRVRSFLDDSQNVEEALAVNMELSRLEGEIERIKGRTQFLSESAAYSSITVQLTPDVLSRPIEVAGWQPKGIARDAIESLINALQSTLSFLIWVGIYVLPLGLLYGVPVWLVIRLVVRWRRRRKAGAA